MRVAAARRSKHRVTLSPRAARYCAAAAALLVLGGCSELKPGTDRAAPGMDGSVPFDAGSDLNTGPRDLGSDDLGPSCEAYADAAAPLAPLATPLCTAATQAAVLACGPATASNYTCVLDALRADTTPGVVIDGNLYTCSRCAQHQMMACLREMSCSEYVDTYACCAIPAGCSDLQDCAACGYLEVVGCLFANPGCADVESTTLQRCF